MKIKIRETSSSSYQAVIILVILALNPPHLSVSLFFCIRPHKVFISPHLHVFLIVFALEFVFVSHSSLY